MNADEIRATFQQWGMYPPPVILYDEIGPELRRCVYLYRGDEVGHWCCILFHPRTDSWEIFDPMGLYPDKPLDVPGIVKVPKLLLKLALAQDKMVDYNEFAHQGLGTRTCGLWCVWRMLHHNLTFDEFRDRYSKMTDEEICRLFNKPELLLS